MSAALAGAEVRLVPSIAQDGIALSLVTGTDRDIDVTIPLRRGRGVAFARAVPSGVLDVASPARLEQPSLFRLPDGGIGAVALRRTAMDPAGRCSVTVFTADDPTDPLLEERFSIELADGDASDPRVTALDGVFELSWANADVVSTVRLDATGSSLRSRSSEPDRGTAELVIDTALATALVARYGRETAEASSGSQPAVFIADRADPSIVRWGERWLFIATDEAAASRETPGLLIRSAPDIPSLATGDDHLILGPGPADIGGCFWAPELHERGGTLWCLFSPSVGSTDWSAVQSHAMRLREGGDPTDPQAWDAPVPVLDAARDALQLDASHPGVSLDMTVFDVAGVTYAVWSQRYILGTLQGDAELWIATVSADDPTRLTSSAVRLARPDLAWEMVGASVVEAAFATFHEGSVVLQYSASGVGADYAVGILTARIGADLLDPASWTKNPYPVADADPAAGVWGPGHGMFTHDESGAPLSVLHLKTTPAESFRHAAIRPFGWTAAGLPTLDPRLRYDLAPTDLERPA